MYIIGGAQLKFVYMLVDSFFFFLQGPQPPPRGNVAPPLPSVFDSELALSSPHLYLMDGPEFFPSYFCVCGVGDLG